MSLPRISALLAYLKRLDLKELVSLPSLAVRVMGKSASLASEAPASSKDWLFAKQNLDILFQIEKSRSAVEARKTSSIMSPRPSPYSKALAEVIKGQALTTTAPIQVMCKQHYLSTTYDPRSSIKIVLSNSLLSGMKLVGDFGEIPTFYLKIGKLNRHDVLRFTTPLTRYYATIQVSSFCLHKKHGSNFEKNIRQYFILEPSP